MATAMYGKSSGGSKSGFHIHSRGRQAISHTTDSLVHRPWDSHGSPIGRPNGVSVGLTGCPLAAHGSPIRVPWVVCANCTKCGRELLHSGTFFQLQRRSQRGRSFRVSITNSEQQTNNASGVAHPVVSPICFGRQPKVPTNKQIYHAEGTWKIKIACTEGRAGATA